MGGGKYKKRLFEQFARVGKALANANRLELLEYIAQGEKGVEALAKVAGLSVANTSQHLQQLRYAGLVSTRKDGQFVYYRLTDESGVDILALLRKIAEKNLAEVDQIINSYFKLKDDMEAVPAEELLDRARQGLVTVLDVRPQDEYEAGHIAGAINVPMKLLVAMMKELKPDKEVVAYCRGPYCVLAFEAVAKLREQGFNARRLDGGFPEWKRDGLPTEEG